MGIHKAADAFELLQHLSSRGLSIQELTNAALATSPTEVKSPSPSPRSRSRRQLLSHERKKTKNEKETRDRPKRRRSSKAINSQQREQKKQQQDQQQQQQQKPCHSDLVADADTQTLHHQTLHSSFGDFHYADNDNEDHHNRASA